MHQPNSAIFSLFDHVLLLSRGKVAYFGSASAASEFCLKAGVPCPPAYHIADHLLDVAAGSAISINVNAFGDNEIRARPRRATAHEFGSGETIKDVEVVDSISLSSFSEVDASLGASTITKIEKVLGRSLKVFLRNPLLFWSHFLLSSCLGAFIGMLYFHVDNTLAGLQNRLGSIFFMQALLAFGGLSAISSLTEDRILFIRERSNGFYGALPYFLSKILFDLVPLRIIPAIILCSTSYFLIGFTNDAATFLKFLLIMVVFSMNAGLHGFFIACLVFFLLMTDTRNFNIYFSSSYVHTIPNAIFWDSGQSSSNSSRFKMDPLYFIFQVRL